MLNTILIFSGILIDLIGIGIGMKLMAKFGLTVQGTWWVLMVCLGTILTMIGVFRKMTENDDKYN